MSRSPASGSALLIRFFILPSAWRRAGAFPEPATEIPAEHRRGGAPQCAEVFGAPGLDERPHQVRVALIGKVHRLTERDHAPEEEKTARERDVQDMTGPASSQSGKAADGGGQRQDDDLVFAEGRVKPRLYANPAKDREQQRVDDAKAH